MSQSYIEVELNRQPVELCKLLKIANLVGGGGAAKIVISEGYVLLNGEVEYQKRKKIYHEDVVEFNGEVIQLIINDDLTEQPESTLSIPEPVPESIKGNAKSKKPTKNKTTKSCAITDKSKTVTIEDAEIVMPRKRKPISF